MNSIQYTLHRRQFYIGPAAKKFKDDCQSIRLTNDLILTYCSTLPVLSVVDSAQRRWLLLGDAIEASSDRPSPSATLKNLKKTDRVEDISSSWAGRWLLISETEIHPDAAALLGCYYTKSSGALEIASSPSLLIKHDKKADFILPKKTVGMKFYPLPLCGYTGLSKLLPSQVLDMNTGTTRFRTHELAIPALYYEDTLSKIIELLCNILKQAPQYFNLRLRLALTGGYDSRLLMACLERANIDYDTVTFYHSLMNPHDKNIPARLAQIVKKRHRLIRKGTLVKSREDLYNRHSGFHAVERDKDYMVYQQFEQLEAGNTVLIRGGAFEVGTCAYYRPLPETLIEAAEIQERLKINDPQTASIQQWLSWVKQTPYRKLDWRDRFYIEQRLAGWLSCTEQALDLVNIERLVPANCALLYNYFLSIPENKRHKKVYEEDIIRMLCPQLLTVPINPDVSVYYHQYRKTKYKLEKFIERVPVLV